MLAVDSTRADRVLAWGAPDAGPAGGIESTLAPGRPCRPCTLQPGPVEVDVDLQEMRSPSPLTLVGQARRAGRLRVPRARPAAPGRAHLPRRGAGRVRRAAAGWPAWRSTTPAPTSSSATRPAAGGRPQRHRRRAATWPSSRAASRCPAAWRPGAPTIGGPEVRLQPGRGPAGRAAGARAARTPRSSAATRPEPLPAVVDRRGRRPVGGPGRRAGGRDDRHVGDGHPLHGPPGRRLRSRAPASEAVLVDLELALRLDDEAQVGEQRGLAVPRRPGDEQALVRRAAPSPASPCSRARRPRRPRAGLRRRRCGAGAAAAAGLRRRRGRRLGRRAARRGLRRAGASGPTRWPPCAPSGCGGVRSAPCCCARTSAPCSSRWSAARSPRCVAVWAVLPALPQFDDRSSSVPVRYAPEASAGWLAVGGLGRSPRRGRPHGRRPAAAHRSLRPAAGRSAMT